MPRLFLYVALAVIAAVTSAYSYRLYRDSQCCKSTLPSAESPAAPLSLILPAERPSSPSGAQAARL